VEAKEPWTARYLKRQSFPFDAQALAQNNFVFPSTRLKNSRWSTEPSANGVRVTLRANESSRYLVLLFQADDVLKSKPEPDLLSAGSWAAFPWAQKNCVAIEDTDMDCAQAAMAGIQMPRHFLAEMSRHHDFSLASAFAKYDSARGALTNRSSRSRHLKAVHTDA